MIKSIHVNYDQLPYNKNMQNDQTVLDAILKIGKEIASDLSNYEVIDIRKYIRE